MWKRVWVLCALVMGCGDDPEDPNNPPPPRGGFTLTIEISGKGSVDVDTRSENPEPCIRSEGAPISSCVNDTDGQKTCMYTHVEPNPNQGGSGMGLCLESESDQRGFNVVATPAGDWKWENWVTIPGSQIVCDDPPGEPMQFFENVATDGHIKCRANFSPAARTLIGVVVSPANVSVAAGATTNLTATGTYSDNTTFDATTQATWTSQNTAVATVSGGVVIAATAPPSPPTTTVTATLEGHSGSSSVSVGPRAPLTIVITPDNPSVADGLTVDLQAWVTYTDGTTQDATQTAVWSSSNTSVATVSNASPNAGIVTAEFAGTATIMATANGLTDTTMVQVTPAAISSIAISPDPATVADGLTLPFGAMGTFTNGSMSDVTTMVNWTILDPTIATIGASTGIATTVGNTQLGTTTVTATLGTATDTAQLTVTPATLASLQVTPDPTTLVLGRTRAFTATGTMTDGQTIDVTNTATWTPFPANRIAVTSGGLASTPSGATTGLGTVTATSGTISDSANVTVTPAELVSIAIAPDPLSMSIGQLQQLTVNGLFSDGTTGDVTSMATWMTSNMNVATVNGAGVCTAQSSGNATLTALVNLLTDTLGLSVVPAISFWVELTLPYAGGFSPLVMRLVQGMYLFAGHGTDSFLDIGEEFAGTPGFTRVLLGQGEPQAGARPLADGSKVVLGRNRTSFRGWMSRLDATNSFAWQQTLTNASRFSAFAPSNASTMTAAYVDDVTSRAGLMQFDPATGTITRAVLSNTAGFTLSRMESLPGTTDVIATSGDTVFRFDLNLAPVWQKTITGASIQTLDVTPAGQILLTRTAANYSDVVVLAPDGQLVRQTEYGPAGMVSLRSIAPTTTGFVATGTVNGAQTVILMNTAGTPTAARSFSDTPIGMPTLSGAFQNPDGSIAVGGRNTTRNVAMKVAADLSVPGCSDATLGVVITPSTITTTAGTPTITDATATFSAVSPLPTPVATTFTASSGATGSTNACTN